MTQDTYKNANVSMLESVDAVKNVEPVVKLKITSATDLSM